MKKFYVIECAELLAFKTYEEAQAFALDYFDSLDIVYSYEKAKKLDFFDFKNATLCEYNKNTCALVQYGYSPINLL